MDFSQVKKYWEERASTDSSAQSTTQDYYLREIEFRVISGLIKKYRPTYVMDIGCGDARTTARLAVEFEALKFIGGDYSESMLRNAQGNIDRAKIDNLDLMFCDISQPLPSKNLDVVYSTRCLINLPTWELQQIAIENIADSLNAGGYYIMIENFIEGHENFNHVRESFGLPKITVREHNLFFNRFKLLDFVSNRFDTKLQSTYY